MSAELHNDIMQHLDKPVVLVGMMGVGKSHLGWLLAQALGLEFFDSDKSIEAKAGRSTSEIFEEFGEDKFREAEHNTILELLQHGPCVIASGGGALTNAETLEALKDRSIMIWLDADLEVLWQRVQKSQHRPLLQTDNPRETLQNLMDRRRAAYEQAHIHIETSQDQSANTADSLIKALYDFLNEDTV